MPYKKLNDHLEYFTGMGGYIATSLSISPFMDRVISAVISFTVGVSLVIATHFIKKYLNRKHPIK